MEPSAGTQTRRTRIVCISDTHNCNVKLPKGDVLIHAGDLTNQGSYSELSKAVKWLDSTAFEAKIIIAGNHDLTLDRRFYSHSTGSEDPSRSISLFTSSRSLTYLCHESATIQLVDPKGPRTRFKVFGSPYSPRCGRWAFSYDRSEASTTPESSGPTAAEIWHDVPSDVDILVTHTPARTHCDACPDTKQPLGCEDLRLTLNRVRPRLHVCGHIHHGRGSERLRWDMDSSDSPAVESWLDPSPDPKSAKICLVDLTSRGGKRSLGIGTVECEPVATTTDPQIASERVPSPEPVVPSGQLLGRADRDESGTGSVEPPSMYNPDSETSGFSVHATDAIVQNRSVGRQISRHETRVVNCAVVATNFPHAGGKRFNKPIVVDVDLPVWG